MVASLCNGAEENATGKVVPSLRVNVASELRRVRPSVRTSSSEHSSAGIGWWSASWKWMVSCIGLPMQLLLAPSQHAGGSRVDSR